jgi:hypothetical protein
MIYESTIFVLKTLPDLKQKILNKISGLIHNENMLTWLKSHLKDGSHNQMSLQ